MDDHHYITKLGKKKKNPNVAPCFGKLFINESMVKGYTCNL